MRGTDMSVRDSGLYTLEAGVSQNMKMLCSFEGGRNPWYRAFKDAVTAGHHLFSTIGLR
jgi:hypothetical protein